MPVDASNLSDLERIRNVLVEWDRGDLSTLLASGSLDTWTHPDQMMELVMDDVLAQYYAETEVTLSLPDDAVDCLDEADSQTICEAMGEVFGALGNVRIERVASASTEPSSSRRAIPGEWDGMRFRSQTEMRIAEALDRANVAFWPNARGRVGANQDSRFTREPDFLVVADGKLGILEVDGEHHRGMAAEDQERDRLFKAHGVRVVERFPAARCYDMPDDVVAEFLQLLRLNG